MEEEKLLEGIQRFRERRNAVIVAHNYQAAEIQDIADFVGDSFAMACYVASTTAPVVIVAGVRFMAETVKIISPEKTVLIPTMDAGCPLADTIKVEDVQRLRRQHANAAVVSYVNTSAEVKAVSDICCTSSNAVKVVRSLQNKDVVFVPDRNLGRFVAKHVPEKNIITWDGSCPVHADLRADEVLLRKKEHPKAMILAHPECREEVLCLADFVGSTSEIILEAQTNSAKEFIVATEIGVLHALNKQSGKEKFFYGASDSLLCKDMKKISLEGIYVSLCCLRYEVILSDEIIKAAYNPLLRMLNVG